jgi:hypothetical protein
MTSWGNTGMQTDDYDARHSAYDFDVYSDNGTSPLGYFLIENDFAHHPSLDMMLNNEKTLTKDPISIYNQKGMVLSTPSASAKKRRGAAYVQPLTIPVSPNFATSRCV